jgi:hypothetical protein
MNRLRIYREIALIVPPISALVLSVFETLGVGCETPLAEASAVPERPSNPTSSVSLSIHCLIYGKCCLTGTLQGR